MKFFTKSLTAVAASLLAFSSFAQDVKGYVGVEYGSFKFKDQTSVASGLVSAVGGSASSVQDTGMSVGRFFGGMKITENFGAELGYILSGTANATFSGVSGSSVAYSGGATQKASGFDYSAIVRPSVSSGFNGLFLRVGGHSVDIKTDVSIASGASSGVSGVTKSGTGSLIGFGYDGNINDKLSGRIAYTNYSSVANISGNDVSLFTIGLVYRF